MIRAKLVPIAPGVVMSAPSPRIRVLWHHNDGTEHVVAYLGFPTLEAAQACYDWLVERVGRYDRQTNAGVNKPRKARRVGGCQYELKWHSPAADILAVAIRKDLARVAKETTV